jgi:hypothetical protein
MRANTDKKLKKYRVHAWEECTYDTYIEAKSKEEAEKIAYKEISIAGFNNWNIGKHGDTEVIEVEELSDD